MFYEPVPPPTNPTSTSFASLSSLSLRLRELDRKVLARPLLFALLVALLLLAQPRALREEPFRLLVDVVVFVATWAVIEEST